MVNRFLKENHIIIDSCIYQLNKMLWKLPGRTHFGAIARFRGMWHLIIRIWSEPTSFAKIQLSCLREPETRLRLKHGQGQLVLDPELHISSEVTTTSSLLWPEEDFSIPFFFSFFDGAFGAACWSGWPLVVLVSTSLDMARRQTATLVPGDT